MTEKLASAQRWSSNIDRCACSHGSSGEERENGRQNDEKKKIIKRKEGMRRNETETRKT